VGDGQYKSYRFYVDKIIIPAIGSLALKSVTSVHLQKLLNSREGKSKSDIDKLRITVKAIFSKARKVTPPLITQNPAENLETPAAEEGSRRRITDYERGKILALAETHKTAGLWIKLMLYTGLRPGETRALNWQHINFDKRLICVRRAMKAGSKKIGAPKTKAGERDIPIHVNLLPGLEEAYALAKSKATARDADNVISINRLQSDPVFTQPTTGRRHTKTSMRCLWDAFKKELDITMGAKFEKKEAKDGKMRSVKILSVIADDLVPYCLRHTCCTDWEEAGVPINVAKYLMGHKDIKTTSKIYTHTTEKTIQAAAKLIDEYATRAQ
jgi:integrase